MNLADDCPHIFTARRLSEFPSWIDVFAPYKALRERLTLLYQFKKVKQKIP